MTPLRNPFDAREGAPHHGPYRSPDNPAHQPSSSAADRVRHYVRVNASGRPPRCAGGAGAVDVFGTWDYRVGQASAYVPLPCGSGTVREPVNMGVHHNRA